VRAPRGWTSHRETRNASDEIDGQPVYISEKGACTRIAGASNNRSSGLLRLQGQSDEPSSLFRATLEKLAHRVRPRPPQFTFEFSSIPHHAIYR